MAALIPLLLALAGTAFVVIMGWLFFQFSKPGQRLVPTLVILAGLTLGAVLFLLKLKAFALVAVIAIVAVGFILAATAEEKLTEQRKRSTRSNGSSGIFEEK